MTIRNCTCKRSLDYCFGPQGLEQVEMVETNSACPEHGIPPAIAEEPVEPEKEDPDWEALRKAFGLTGGIEVIVMELPTGMSAPTPTTLLSVPTSPMQQVSLTSYYWGKNWH